MSNKFIRYSTLCLLCCSASLWADDCKGSLLLFSDQAQLIEEYSNKVRIYVPLKIRVSNKLLDCADEIWIESLDSSQLKFYGPGLNKNSKLLNAQFKTINKSNGQFKVSLSARETQLWLGLQHYSFFPAGSYQMRVKVSLAYMGAALKEQLIDLEYQAQPQISLELDNSSRSRVSGSGGDYQIDLGQLHSNQQFNWGIKVLSNSAYDIVLDSQYKGLRHHTNHQALIDYSIWFDHVKIPATAQLTRRYHFAAGVKNTWFGLAIELGSVELMPAGSYNDNISLTIYPY